jgi:hypothetical protein
MPKEENKEKLIEEFVDEETIKALTVFIGAKNAGDCIKETDTISRILGATGTAFSMQDKNAENKLIISFKHNLKLLIQKTWVEKSDIELKEQVLYQIEQFCRDDDRAWSKLYVPFLEMIGTAVYLMFGQQTKSEEFNEWAFRIDPEFGIFWWYISSLPHNTVWPEDKCRIAILLGMYFLANY